MHLFKPGCVHWLLKPFADRYQFHMLKTKKAAQGGMITLASYSNFNNNNLQDTFIITVGTIGLYFSEYDF